MWVVVVIFSRSVCRGFGGGWGGVLFTHFFELLILFYYIFYVIWLGKADYMVYNYIII